MSRDHRNLRVFHEAHAITLAIYRHSKNFPRDEWFGLRSQMRRAAVSIPSNLVEGSARRTTREYLNFLNVARASASELSYLVRLSFELNFLSRDARDSLLPDSERLTAGLEGLLQRIEILESLEDRSTRKRRYRKPARTIVQGLSHRRKPRAASRKP